MWLDIFICIFALISAFIGWRIGLVRGLLGFVSSIASLAVAIFTAKHLANLSNTWWNLSKAFDNFIKGSGEMLNYLFCAVLIYIVMRIVFFFIGKFVKKIKSKNKAFDWFDKIAGIFLGLGKYAASLCMAFITLYFASVIPFMDGVMDWLFTDSSIGQFLYDATIEYIIPLFGDIQAATMGILPIYIN